MKDVDENGVDCIHRFRAYSERFRQFSVAHEVYEDTLEYILHLRKERDEAMEFVRGVANDINALSTRPKDAIRFSDLVYTIQVWGDNANEMLKKKENTND